MSYPGQRINCIGIFLLALGLAACAQDQSAVSKMDSVNVVLGSAPITLDPHYSNESVAYTINANIYETLVRTDSDLNLVPALATKWTNPDDYTWVFELDPKARFHNGKLCTSQDVAYSLERVRSDPKSDWKGSLVTVDRIETPTAHRVVLHTKVPFPILLRYLSPLAIVPKDSVNLDKEPIGTGPYKLQSGSISNGRLQLSRWERYHGDRPEIERGTFSWIHDDASRLQTLRSGRADLVTDVPPDAVPVLTKIPELRMEQIPSLRVLYLAFDVHRKKSPYIDSDTNPFQDRRVRWAFQRAIDRARLNRDVFHGLADPATQIVAPAVFGYNADLPVQPFDLSSARTLMQDAGYGNGFSVTLDAPYDAYPGDSATADFVGAALNSLNVKVRQNKMSKPDLFRKVAARDTSFYLISWNCLSGDAQEVFTYLLHTPDPARGYGPDNSGSYSNADVDQLVEQAEQVMDSGRRLDLLRRAMGIVMEDAPWIPLSIQTHLFGVQGSLQWKPREDRLILFREMKFRDPNSP